MTVAEKRFEMLITNFVFAEHKGNLASSPKWQMLNKETQTAYIKLIAHKTR